MKNGEAGSRSLKQVAYERISAMILSGELDSDEELHEIPLSLKLGISRTPIREAFLQLEKEGLIEIVPRKGAFLRKTSAKEIQELFQVREAVEGLAAYLAAGKLTDADLRYLTELFSRSEKAMEPAERKETLEFIGDELHRVILMRCNNARMVEILNNYQTILSLERKQASSIPVQMEEAFREHQAIFAGLQSSPSEAEAAMRKHIRNTMDSLLRCYY